MDSVLNLIESKKISQMYDTFVMKSHSVTNISSEAKFGGRNLDSNFKSIELKLVENVEFESINCMILSSWQFENINFESNKNWSWWIEISNLIDLIWVDRLG